MAGASARIRIPYRALPASEPAPSVRRRRLVIAAGPPVTCGQTEEARNMAEKGTGTEGSRLVTDQEALDFHSRGRPGKLEVIADEADGDAARPLARLFARRGRSGAAHRRGPDRRPSTTRRAATWWPSSPTAPRSSGLGNLGALAVEAGDGRQGGALQALRRHRFHRPGGRHRERRRIRQRRPLSRAVLRRHQPGGYPRAGLLRHREPAARADGHPGLPRRPAWHRDHRARRR